MAFPTGVAQTLSGCRSKIVLNGVDIGLVSGVTITWETQLVPVDVIGLIVPAELAEVGHTVSGSFSKFLPVKSGLVQLGLLYDNDPKALINRGSSSLVVYSSVDQNGEMNDSEVGQVTGLKISGGSMQVSARGLWEGQFNFTGISLRGWAA